MHLQSVGPIARPAALMCDRENLDLVTREPIDDRVGKSACRYAAHMLSKGERLPWDGQQ
jgi:hypothetical protein